MSRANATPRLHNTDSPDPLDEPNGRAHLGQKSREVPRFALTKAEAAASIGMSVDSFERHVQAELRLVRRGKLVLVPVAELVRWLEWNAARTLDVA